MRDALLPDWQLVELQGELEPPAERDASASVDGVRIGELTPKPVPKGAYSLHIANNLLGGREEALKTPLVVLRKVRNEHGATIALEALGLIKRRVVFKTRPRPITQAHHLPATSTSASAAAAGGGAAGKRALDGGDANAAKSAAAAAAPHH
jgi:hypothetical protein